MQAVGNKGSKKSNTRKTRNPPTSASARKKQKVSSGSEPPAHANLAVGQQAVNKTVSCVSASARRKQKVSSGSEPPAHASLAVGQQAVNKTVSCVSASARRKQKVSSGSEPPAHANLAVGQQAVNKTLSCVSASARKKQKVSSGSEPPGAYGTPQIVAHVNVQEHIPPSQLEDTEAESKNTLKIVDVFSVREISKTSTPEYVTRALQSSSNLNWHSPSPTEDKPNLLPSSTCSIQSSSKNPSTIRNWHTPVSANNPHKSCKEREKVVDSGSTVNSMSLPEEEDEVLVVKIVRVNKESVAQHWERCPSGFICKLCNKPYKRLNRCENHIQIHLGVKPYECQICKRRYHKRRMLNEHYSFHAGIKLYQCKKCEKSFRYKNNFKSHAKSHVEELNSSYLCEICNKNFQLQFDYWSHKTSKHIMESQMAEVEPRE